MNEIADVRVLDRFHAAQRGVWSAADLATALCEPHRAAMARRLRRLETAGELRRFSRGFYVRPEFDLPTLSQRIAPESYVSFETVLASALLIGTDPSRRVTAVKPGRARRYEALGFVVEHVGASPELMFGFEARHGVRFADPEKAVLDVLLYHLRGRRYAFDLWSDVDFGRLDRTRIASYLARYPNPRFVAFARRVLELP